MTTQTVINRVNRKINELTRMSFRDDNWQSVYKITDQIDEMLGQISVKEYEHDYELVVDVIDGGYKYDHDGNFIGKEYELTLTDNGVQVATGWLKACPRDNTYDNPFEFKFYEIYGCIYPNKERR